MKKVLFLFMAVVALVLVANQALALNSVFPLFQSGANQASDEDREYLIDRVQANIAVADGTYTLAASPTLYRQLTIAASQGVTGITVTPTQAVVSTGSGVSVVNYGQIDVGDSFRGSINFNTLNAASANVGGTTGTNELSGVFQFLVNAKTNLGTAAVPIWQFDFIPDPAFVGSNVGGHIIEGGGVVAIFEDATPDYAGDFNDPAPATPPAGPDDGTPGRTVPPSFLDVSVGPYATENAFISLASDGTWRMTLGFLGLPGEGVQALQTVIGAPDNILQSFGFTSGTTFTNTNLGLNLLALDPAWAALVINRVTPSVLGGGGLVDFAVSQQVRGVSDLDTPFDLSSNTNISFNATIPEPATLLLLGAGLVGLAGAARRRMKK